MSDFLNKVYLVGWASAFEWSGPGYATFSLETQRAGSRHAVDAVVVTIVECSTHGAGATALGLALQASPERRVFISCEGHLANPSTGRGLGVAVDRLWPITSPARR